MIVVHTNCLSHVALTKNFHRESEVGILATFAISSETLCRISLHGENSLNMCNAQGGRYVKGKQTNGTHTKLHYLMNCLCLVSFDISFFFAS